LSFFSAALETGHVTSGTAIRAAHQIDLDVFIVLIPWGHFHGSIWYSADPIRR
jgi:hypothetical protein